MISLLAFWLGGAGAVPPVVPTDVLVATVRSVTPENTVEPLSAENTVLGIVG